MVTFRELKSALESLELEDKPAIAHASLRSIGDVQGRAETVLKALLVTVNGLVMPTFTYKTMIVPEIGPPNNGLDYGTQLDLNRMAEPFQSGMSVDPLLGVLPDILRQYPGMLRTAHPILSFAGVNANDVLATQTIYNPFAPIGALAQQGGWVLLLGVDNTSNTSIHFAEKLAKRHQFVRWALTKTRILECRHYPGCSDGFEAIHPRITGLTKRVDVGKGFIEAIPLQELLQTVQASIKRDPQAFLCQRETCARCEAVRATL